MTALALPAPASRLQVLLREDAALCLVTGAVAVAAAGPVADLLSTSTGVVRVVGLVLLVAGVDLALFSRLTGRRLVQAAYAAAAVNLLWEVATIALVVAGAFDLAGAVAALALAAVTGVLGLLQLRAARAATPG